MEVIRKLGGKSIAAGILGGAAGKAILSAVGRSFQPLGQQFPVRIQNHFSSGLPAGFHPYPVRKVVDPEGHTNTDINEPGVMVSEEVLKKLLEEVAGRLRKEDIIVLSGSLPAGAPKDCLFQAHSCFFCKCQCRDYTVSGPHSTADRHFRNTGGRV